MIVALNLNEDEGPVWNLMWQMYVPCQEHIMEAGYAWEKAQEKFHNYADNFHDTEDILSAAIYMKLLGEVDKARKTLGDNVNQWYCARHGYSLN